MISFRIHNGRLELRMNPQLNPIVVKRLLGKESKVKLCKSFYGDIETLFEIYTKVSLPLWCKYMVAKEIRDHLVESGKFDESVEIDLDINKMKEELGRLSKKETDEVADTSDDPGDGDKHGGDGNSGECDHPSETKSSEVRNKPRSQTVPQRLVEHHQNEALAKAMIRLFRAISNEASDDIGGILPSPRIDARKLMGEMFIRRYDVNRCRKDELAGVSTKIIVAADTSGSCSASSGHTMEICRVAAALHKDVTFVDHSNGRIIKVFKDGVYSSIKDWDEILKNNKIIGCVLFGDADGLTIFESIWRKHNCPVVWMDSYKASYGKVVRCDYKHVYQHTDHPNDNKVKYYHGVNSSERAALAVRMALRNE